MNSDNIMTKRFDVVICGGGLVGLTLGLAMGRYGVKTAIIDSTPVDKMVASSFDGRVSSIALGSKHVLETIGVWHHLNLSAQEILEIRVSDGNSPFFLHYDHMELGDEPLGWMVENRLLRGALISEVEKCDVVEHLTPVTVSAVSFDENYTTLSLSDGTDLSANLAVGADGRRSFLRNLAQIDTIEWPYKQIGIVCTVRHQFSHNSIAHEKFRPSGPFAILPMTNNRSSLVWTESANLAPKILNLPDEIFLSELSDRLGDFLGEIQVDGPRWSYPLSLCQARSYIAPRLALIGDAAHAIHPIAGQGFNLGIRDCATLAEIVVERLRLGLDVGSPDLLQKYERLRRFDSMMLAGVTDGLNRIFSNDLPPLKLLRGAGLASINQMPPLKRIFMRHAMGLSGNLPRLAQGKPI